ncbi:neuromedin-U receptor 2-like [Saccostrea cucullata]|uniref:neuromedin-U receptor 2-like n=1 Tax=Saccostrea cuccullata TaxID=36930 RepID=UPI002ED5E352
MVLYNFEISATTSEHSMWDSSNMNGDTELNHNTTVWISGLFPLDRNPHRTWNETQSDFDFIKDFTLSFQLFNSYNIDLISYEFEKSVKISALIILILGFVGNVVTICTVLCYKKFHTPTFIAIGCLAFFDTLNIISGFLQHFSTLATYLHNQHVVFDRPFLVMTFYLLREIIFTCSCSYIVFLSMIRYLFIVHPLQSKIRLSASIVMAMSAMIWIFFSLFSAFKVILITTITKDLSFQNKIMHLNSLIMYTLCGLLSICAIIIIHIKKVKALKNSFVANNIHRRMNVTISIILSVFICFQISVLMHKSALFAFSFNFIPRTLVAYTSFLQFLLGTLNYSCNPYMLFFASQIIS